MVRNKISIENDPLTVTASFRVGLAAMARVEDAATKAGITRSDLLRELLANVTPGQLDEAIRAVQLSQLELSQTESAAVLKQKRSKAEKLIAWIDAELKARAEKIQTGASQT